MTLRCPLAHFAESATRAYKFSMTPPWGPTVLAVDQELQENEIDRSAPLVIPKLPQISPPAGEDRRRSGDRPAAGRRGSCR